MTDSTKIAVLGALCAINIGVNLWTVSAVRALPERLKSDPLVMPGRYPNTFMAGQPGQVIQPHMPMPGQAAPGQMPMQPMQPMQPMLPGQMLQQQQMMQQGQMMPQQQMMQPGQMMPQQMMQPGQMMPQQMMQPQQPARPAPPPLKAPTKRAQ